LHHRHRVDELVFTDGAVTGVRGVVLAPDDAPRGAPSNRDAIGEFELSAQAVIIASGGIGANHEMVRRYWPQRMGIPPQSMITGVPAHVDGRMLDIANDAGCGWSPGPDVALHRGHPELEPDLAKPCDPDFAGPVLNVVRRDRAASARTVPARL
jgi:predicted oxidoreductase